MFLTIFRFSKTHSSDSADRGQSIDVLSSVVSLSAERKCASKLWAHMSPALYADCFYVFLIFSLVQCYNGGPLCVHKHKHWRAVILMNSLFFFAHFTLPFTHSFTHSMEPISFSCRVLARLPPLLSLLK